MHVFHWRVLIVQLISLVVFSVGALAARAYYRKQTFDAARRYATFWPRFWSGWGDGLVLWPVSVLVVVLSVFGASGSEIAAAQILQVVVQWIYVVWLHARFGQTVGKMMCRVRVVDARTEQPITFVQALLREGVPILVGLGGLIWMVRMTIAGEMRFDGSHRDGAALFTSRAFWLFVSLPLFWTLAELVTMLANSKRRAIHDFIAGTVVIRTSSAPAGSAMGGAPEALPT